MGKAKGGAKPSTDQFIKKGTGTIKIPDSKSLLIKLFVLYVKFRSTPVQLQ